MAREIPQYITQLNLTSAPKIGVSFEGAQATKQVSAQLGAMAEDVQRKSTDLQNLKIDTAYKENLHRIYNENRDNPQNFDAAYSGFYKQFKAELPNTEFAQKLDIQHNLMSQSYRDRVMEQYSSNIDEEHKAEELKTLTLNKSIIGEHFKNLANAKTPEARKSAMDGINQINEQDAGILAAKDNLGRMRYSPEFQTRELIEKGKMAFTSLPPQKQLEVLGDNAGGFESAQALVAKHEGGYAPIDGNTGQPSLFGVNRKWHPEGYAQIEAVYKTKGSAAGSAAAAEYLKKTFWDANGIDQMDARVQGIVYDGAINHRTTFVKELVSAAKSGASPSELLEMRQAEYDRLAASGKYSKEEVASWNNRLQDYQHLAVTDYEKYVDSETKDQLLRGARSQVEAQMKLEREDPVKAAFVSGARTLTDIVHPQLAKGTPQQFVRVMDNQDAEVTAQRINQALSTDDVMASVQELQAKYGEYMPNAIADLKEKGKMKPEMEGALVLASKNNPAYKEHIDLLTQVGVHGSEITRSLYQKNGYSNSDLATKLTKETVEWQKAIMAEGAGAQIPEKLAVIQSLVQARMNQKLDGKYEDAIEFAIKPELDAYAIREYNDNQFRVPTQFNADDVENEVKNIVANKLPSMVKGSGNEDYVFNKEVSPFMNQTEDGVMFRTYVGEPLRDTKGNLIEFKFKDMQGAKKQPTPITTQQPTAKRKVAPQVGEDFKVMPNEVAKKPKPLNIIMGD